MYISRPLPLSFPPALCSPASLVCARSPSRSHYIYIYMHMCVCVCVCVYVYVYV
jgi:hypothetical protein